MQGSRVHPADVRRQVGAALSTCATPVPETRIQDAQLVATELVTNALLHAGGLDEFQLDVSERHIHLTAVDSSTELPTRQRSLASFDAAVSGGFGWPLICHLAEDTEIRLSGAGKAISVRLPL
ncbi:ATP-binding protein [Streptomyces sp. 135]|uniref:ATP-binding protein n=1 Tax=Streptomyces sp. 135 TaxID=2838850 RepID=UPI001CBAB8FB|nr:ATP-binding protein [Streptomyces sp. 135]